jgi:hypothetical protein
LKPPVFNQQVVAFDRTVVKTRALGHRRNRNELRLRKRSAHADNAVNDADGTRINRDDFLGWRIGRLRRVVFARAKCDAKKGNAQPPVAAVRKLALV